MDTGLHPLHGVQFGTEVEEHPFHVIIRNGMVYVSGAKKGSNGTQYGSLFFARPLMCATPYL
jgi:hypothetical protein